MTHYRTEDEIAAMEKYFGCPFCRVMDTLKFVECIIEHPTYRDIFICNTCMQRVDTIKNGYWAPKDVTGVLS